MRKILASAFFIACGALSPISAQIGDWGIITVDTNGDTGYNPSMALDSQRRPHVAYMDWGKGYLRYARWDGNQWILETVASFADVGGTPSLDLDSQDNPHISYYDFDHGDLRYSKKTAGGWVHELVDSAGDVGLWSSLKVGSDGRVHIAYEDLSMDAMDLKYAVRNLSGVWQTQTVDSAGDVGQYASLDLDSQQLPHIAYLDYPNNLKYAKRNAGGSWTIEAPDTEGWCGFYASLELDSSNVAHVAHQEIQGQNLRYSKRAAGGGWTSVTVDSIGDVGEFLSLALGPDGRPSISYYDSTPSNLKLKYARLKAGGWSIETLNNSEAESWNTSTKVDNQNNPHIAYLNWLPGDLMYARWSKSPILAWTGEAGYTSDGLEPEQGNTYTHFTYRVRFWDHDGEPPLADYPQVHVYRQDDTELPESPYIMTSYLNQGTTSYWQHTLTLPEGSYKYAFEAKDRWGVTAIGTYPTGNPTIKHAGPVVSTTTYPSSGEEVYVYPNPARGDHLIFHVASGYFSPNIEVKIFDIAGTPVNTLGNDLFPKNNPPVYEYKWDLKSERGDELASGVYVYFVHVRDQQNNQEFKTTKKFAILK